MTWSQFIFVSILLLVLLLFPLELGNMIHIFSLMEIFLLSICLYKTWFHIIMMMLILELMGVIIFKVVSLSVNISLSSSAMFLFIVLMVMEASVGMGLVVSNSRSWNDSLMV